MDMKNKAYELYNLDVEKNKKIEVLNEFLLDCLREMEAQDQNMHPEVQHKVSEGYRLAKDFLRELDK